MTKWSKIVDAIAALHAPMEHMKAEGDKWVICNVCKVRYPCPTVAVIDEMVGE